MYVKNSKEFSKMVLETIRQISHDHIIQGQYTEINVSTYKQQTNGNGNLKINAIIIASKTWTTQGYV